MLKKFMIICQIKSNKVGILDIITRKAFVNMTI